jgi:hypothetical protein
MKEIRDKQKITEEDLKDLGPEMPNEDGAKTQLLWSMITDFIQTYKNTISGRYDHRRAMSSNENRFELSGGARIKMNFYNLYQEFEGYRACTEYNDMHV